MAEVDEIDGPLCPITGAPPKRRVQFLSAGFLTDLWRYSFRVDVRDQFTGIKRFGLWESPTGLLYFDPPIAGDAAFYRRYYERTALHDRLSGTISVRGEFALAASHLRPGDRVLDVGCGKGGFRAYVPDARYTGLDPNFGGAAPYLLAETIETHAASHAAAYDVVCAFEVIEHVPDPMAFVQTMLTTLRPGGRLLIGVPCWPSPMTSLPNFVMNAPPHHLTLWNRSSLEALAGRLGLVCRAVEPVPLTKESSILYWMDRAAPKLQSDRLFRHAWSWYLALIWAYAAGALLDRLLPVPEAKVPLNLLLVADKPQ